MMGKNKKKHKKGKQQPQQQKQEEEEEVEVEAASEPQDTHEKVESRVVANAQNAAAAATEPREQKEPPPIYPFNLVSPLAISFCQPSVIDEEEPHSGESQTPKSGGEDFSVSQSNLFDLMHAIVCRHSDISIETITEDPAQCIPRCREAKILLRHSVQCEANKNEHCNYSEKCLVYRALLGHWVMCYISDCKICSSKEVGKISSDYFIATKATLAANKGEISNRPSLPDKSKSRGDRTETVKQEAKTSMPPQLADFKLVRQAIGGTECIEASSRGTTSVGDTDLREMELAQMVQMAQMIPHARDCMQHPKMKGGRKQKCLKKNCESVKSALNHKNGCPQSCKQENICSKVREIDEMMKTRYS